MLRRIFVACAAAVTAAKGLKTATLRAPPLPPSGATQDICNILAFSGGGAFGAVELGILDGLLEAQSIPTSYDILTGISAGGLNAAFLSYSPNITAGVAEAHGIVAGLTTADVYSSAILDLFSKWAIYSNAPLEATLRALLSGRVRAPGAPLTLVGATNVNTEQLDVFPYSALDFSAQIDTLMATSAIPLVFPPRTINGSLYVDGGVINNELIIQAMGQLACGFYKFVYISASEKMHARNNVTGLLSYVSTLGRLLLDTFDYQLAAYESMQCVVPRGAILACFPTSPALDSYSILNFDYGAELYDLGKSAYNCTTLEIC